MTPALTDMTEYYDDEALFAQGIKWHKIWRKAANFMLSADYFPLTECHTTPTGWCGLQFDKDGTGYVQAIRNVQAPQETLTLRPFVHDQTKIYTFTEAISGKVYIVTGADLYENGMTFSIPQKQGQLWFYTSQ